MYIFPGYSKYQILENSIKVKSELYESEIIIEDEYLKNEFKEIVNLKKINEIDTELKKTLYELNIIQDSEEVKSVIDNLNNIVDNHLFLTLMPTENCNFKCRYCYEDESKSVMSDVTLTHIKNFIKLKSLTSDVINISWFGGEPLLCPNIIDEITLFVNNLCKQRSIKNFYSMTTNGYLLDINTFKRLFSLGLTDFQITIDGWNHDKFRPLKSGNGSLKKILENIKAISELPQEYNFSVKIRRNILNNDLDFSWYDYLYDILGNDDRFSFLIVKVCDWGGDSVKSLDLLKNKDIIKKHTDYIQELGLKNEEFNRTIFSDICFSSFKNGYIFRSNGLIEKCTICINNPKNIVGYVDPSKGVVLNTDKCAKWEKRTINDNCLICDDLLKCLNRCCRKCINIDGLKEVNCLCKINGVNI